MILQLTFNTDIMITSRTYILPSVHALHAFGTVHTHIVFPSTTLVVMCPQTVGHTESQQFYKHYYTISKTVHTRGPCTCTEVLHSNMTSALTSENSSLWSSVGRELKGLRVFIADSVGFHTLHATLDLIIFGGGVLQNRFKV